MDRIGKYQYHVESFNLDCTERLSLSVLGNQLLNAAARHAESLGYGRESMRRQGLAWVFSRLAIHMQEYPREFDDYTIATWVASVSRSFSTRCFAVVRPDGTLIGTAQSVWAILDLTQRTSVAIADVLPAYADSTAEATPYDAFLPAEAPRRVRVQADEPLLRFRPLFCDMDYNGHFNSIRYIEHFLDAIPLEEYRQRPVRSIELAYSTECHYGEPLAIYAVHPTSDDYYLELRSDTAPSATPSCRCHIAF